MPAWPTDSEPLEKTPLLASERTGQHDKNSLTCYTGVRHHSRSSSINSQHSQLESGPSCSRSPIYRRSYSAETLLSPSSPDKESNEDSPNQPLSSRSEPLCKARKWVELRLENSGSVARDHLASERTFLAYMRTSLAIASSGVGEFLYNFRAY